MGVDKLLQPHIKPCLKVKHYNQYLKLVNMKQTSIRTIEIIFGKFELFVIGHISMIF